MHYCAASLSARVNCLIILGNPPPTIWSGTLYQERDMRNLPTNLDVYDVNIYLIN
jgi:hypothetical protein